MIPVAKSQRAVVEPAPKMRSIDLRFNHPAGTAAKVLRPSELSFYSEFMAISPSRYSKSKIFTDYKELHNKKNLKQVNRSDKRYFTK